MDATGPRVSRASVLAASMSSWSMSLPRSAMNRLASISERLRKIMRSMQNASPRTRASATSDMKPALPSMNLVRSAWCSPPPSSSAAAMPGSSILASASSAALVVSVDAGAVAAGAACVVSAGCGPAATVAVGMVSVTASAAMAVSFRMFIFLLCCFCFYLRGTGHSPFLPPLSYRKEVSPSSPSRASRDTTHGLLPWRW